MRDIDQTTDADISFEERMTASWIEQTGPYLRLEQESDVEKPGGTSLDDRRTVDGRPAG
jgi:hypothetical protein